MKTFINKYKSIVTAILVCALIYAVLMVSGLRLCAVQSGSMEPTIPTYSMCLVTTHVDYEDIKEGDIIVYNRMSDGLRIIHRAVAVTDEGIVTKGDANQHNDGFSVHSDNLYGRYLGHVPGLAKLYNLFHSAIGAAVIVVLLVILLVLEISENKLTKKQDETRNSEDVTTSEK